MNENKEITDPLLEQVVTGLEHEYYNAAFDTPHWPDAFEMDDDTKMSQIAEHFFAIMQFLGLDLTDDSLKDTPKRVPKMYVKDIFSGLNPINKPKPTLFKYPFKYHQMLVERNIAVFSNCEHHFAPIVGKAHVAYIGNGQVIGLSKLNRIVQYCAQRPQVQERLTVQVANMLKEALGTEDVAVIKDAHHHCVSSRGIRDAGSTTVTAEYSGQFLKADTKYEFLRRIGP